MEDFNTIFPLLSLQYGLDMDDDDAIDVGLIAWRKIGNKRYRLFRLRADVDCSDWSILLPCNCEEDSIEAVTYDLEEWNNVTNLHTNGDINSSFTELYIEGRKRFTDSLYMNGRYVKYDRVRDRLYLHDHIPTVNILYKSYLTDDDGLPLITPKEAEAIACYIAYTEKFKSGWQTNNQQTLLAALLLEQRWLKLCDAARVTKLNQNAMNEILDAKSSWCRKTYGRSYKPIK